MKFVEVTGKNRDEAITNAILELGVPEEQVDIEVLSEGKGLLGLFSKSVKIRATLKEEAALELAEITPAEKKESKGNKKENRNSKAAAPSSADKVAENVIPAEKEEKHSIEVEGRTVTGDKVIIDDLIEQRLRKVNANKKAETAAIEGGKKSEKTDRHYREKKAYNEASEAEEIKEKPVFEPKVFEIPEDADEVMAKTCAFVKELLSAMGIEATVTAKFSEDGIMDVDIAGEGMGLIIGKRGATLDSLQYLATLVINKDRKDHVRLKLDTEGYRARRQETLEKLAINMAKKAKRTGHRVVLEPMNPYERRIIHSALQSESGVDTHSDGEEPYRKVIISPKRRH